MEKFLYYNELYLIYKNLLNQNNSEIFDLYYGENMTMQEIADNMQVSKSRIGSIIKNVEKKLDTYEKALGIHKKNEELNQLFNLQDAKEIKEQLEEILKGE